MTRSIAVIGLTTSVLLLGSCMHGQQALTSGMAWSLQETPEEGVKLAYGAPASDNVVLMMTCQPGAGQVMVSTVSNTPDQKIVLKSGGKTSSMSSTTGPSGMGVGHYLEGSTPASDGAMTRFARTGDITLVQNTTSVRLSASRADRSQVARFFSTCRA
jgi:hypothetical protein